MSTFKNDLAKEITHACSQVLRAISPGFSLNKENNTSENESLIDDLGVKVLDEYYLKHSVSTVMNMNITDLLPYLQVVDQFDVHDIVRPIVTNNLSAYKNMMPDVQSKAIVSAICSDIPPKDQSLMGVFTEMQNMKQEIIQMICSKTTFNKYFNSMKILNDYVNNFIRCVGNNEFFETFRLAHDATRYSILELHTIVHNFQPSSPEEISYKKQVLTNLNGLKASFLG